MPIRNAVIIGVALITSLVCYHKATHSRYADQFVFAMQLVEDNYVEPVKAAQLFENAMMGMVGNLDEYSAYISPQQFQLFSQNIDQQFVGIGIIVQGPPQTNQLTVVTPVYDSPAYRAGLRAGDVILEIDGQRTEMWSVDQAVERIKGPQGTTVTLTVRHEGTDQRSTVVVARDLIQTRSVLGDTRADHGKWNYYLEEDPSIGYVRITTFGERTSEEMKDVLRFRGHPIKALILDLRGNPGGLLSAAVEVSDMFINQGVIVSIRGRRKEDRETYSASPKNTIFDPAIPMVVLVDGYSASASEIVSACLRDHGRAAIVGQRTWGKGTVQNVIMMEHGKAALKLTTASYWRPNGKNIHRRRGASEADDWGVRPTEGLEVVLTAEQYRKVLEQRRDRDILREGTEKPPHGPPAAPDVEDPQLKRAVEYLQSKIKDQNMKAA